MGYIRDIFRDYDASSWDILMNEAAPTLPHLIPNSSGWKIYKSSFYKKKIIIFFFYYCCY